MKHEFDDIVDIIQHKVNKIAKEKYSSPDAKFTVSILQEFTKDKLSTQKIIITIDNGIKHSRVLFPKPDTECGYNSLAEEMEYLFNSTM
jgi:hypothetical protein